MFYFAYCIQTGDHHLFYSIVPLVNPAIPPPGFVGPPPTGPFGVGPRFPAAPAVIPPFQTAPPPPRPVSKEEFYRQKKKLLEQEKK